MSSLKIIGLLHFLKFLGPSAKNYNPQSLMITLYHHAKSSEKRRRKKERKKSHSGKFVIPKRWAPAVRSELVHSSPLEGSSRTRYSFSGKFVTCIDQNDPADADELFQGPNSCPRVRISCELTPHDRPQV